MSGLPDSSTGPRSRLRDVHTVPRENLWNSSTSTLSWWADRPAGRVHRPGFTGQGPVSGMVGGTDVPEGLRWFPDRAGTDRRRLEVKGVDEFFPPLVTNLIRLRLAVLIHTDPVGSEGTHHRRDLGPLPGTEGRPGGRPEPMEERGRRKEGGLPWGRLDGGGVPSRTQTGFVEDGGGLLLNPRGGRTSFYSRSLPPDTVPVSQTLGGTSILSGRNKWDA